MKQYVIEAVQKGTKAARQNMWPGIALQVVAVALIVTYYFTPAVGEFLNKVGEYNTKWSPWFAVVMTMCFGGAIPLLIEGLQRRAKKLPQRGFLQVLFTLLIWAVNGFLTDRFYGLQAHLFGSELEFWTIVKKVIVDQFVWVPIYVVPVFTLTFLWRDCDFSLKRLRASLVKKTFLQRGLPLMISNWSVWIPAVSIIYAFPLPLQLILMNLILIFWGLILTFFVSEEE